MIEKTITPYNGNKNFIFLSYAHKNRDDILKIAKEMQSRKYRIWYDEGIDPGTEWDENIAGHIQRAGYFIAFISHEYLDSENCKDELNLARDLNKERLLIYLDNVQLPIGMQMRLNRLQAIHKYTYSEDYKFYQKLFSAKGIEQYRSNDDSIVEIGKAENISFESLNRVYDQSDIIMKCRDFFSNNSLLLTIVEEDYTLISKLKTAIQNECKTKLWDCKTYYAQDWIDELIDMIRKDILSVRKFREIGLHFDVMYMDGIELFSDKPSSQEELLITIRKRIDKEKKTILLSHRPIDSIPSLSLEFRNLWQQEIRNS